MLDSYNGGAEEVGWRGTYEVIDDSHRGRHRSGRGDHL